MTDYESIEIRNAKNATEKLIECRDNLRAGKTFFIIGKDNGILVFDHDGAKFIYSSRWKCDPYTMGLPMNGCSTAELNFCGIFFNNTVYVLNQYEITTEFISRNEGKVDLPDGMEYLYDSVNAYNQYIQDQLMPDYIDKTDFKPRSVENLESTYKTAARLEAILGESKKKRITRDITLKEGTQILLGVKTCEEIAAEIYEEQKDTIAAVKANMDAEARYIAENPVKEWERSLYLAFRELSSSNAKTVNVIFERGGKTAELKVDPSKACDIVACDWGEFASYSFIGSEKSIEKALKDMGAYRFYNDKYLRPSEIVSVTYGRKTYYTRPEQEENING